MSLHVTVITAVFNSVATIADALQSVRKQSYENVEHIVVDGGSSDGSLELIEAHRARLGMIISEPDDGIYDALNKGIRHATGDVVGFMHADDQFASRDALARVVEAFKDPNVGAVYGDLVYVRKEDGQRVVRYWRAGPYSQDRLAQGWMPPHPTFYLRRELYAELGLFNTRYRIAADYESMLRILGRGGVKPAYIPQTLVRMRMGGASNKSIRNMLIKSSEDYAAMREHGIGGLRALLRKNITKLPQFVMRAPGAHAEFEITR
jgi:glycosyltransferase involved in cell wall biosynthesis